MNVLELNGVTVRYPAQRIVSLKEWAIRTMTASMEKQVLVALDDVSLKIEPGDSVGIVGSNGAGKSTMLRVASGIIQPSSGHSVTRGTVAPIIELGSGFDGELSGRENIFFNGALLGRPRPRIAERFDEIVAFSGLESFIDAPLRTYSTGMVARLAFSVATAVEADLVILDEVLAVGDEAFTTKCGERIRGFYHSGSAVMLVSHDLDAIEELCKTAVWLDHGRVRDWGSSADVVAAYRASLSAEVV